MVHLYRHPLLPALGAALVCQAGLVAMLRSAASNAGGTAAAAQPTTPGDDAPELMRLSRNLLQSSPSPNPGLGQLLSLPLPPPPTLTAPPATQTAKVPATGPTAHKPTKAASSQRAAERKAAQAPTAQSISPRTPVPPKPAAAPTLPGVVPDQPGQALDLAKAIAGGHQALSAEGASPAQVALQRRQWWLSPRDAGLLQRAWDLAEPAEAPSDWNTLPAGTQLRRVPAQALGALTSGDPRGRSLVNREQITLLWGSGTQLWMLRLTLSD
jgi:hypothetical protein